MTKRKTPIPPQQDNSSQADDAATWLAQWRTRIQQGGPWTERFQRLIADTLCLGDALDYQTCEDFAPMLEAYVDDRAHGQIVAATYQRLLTHLATCANCRAEIAALQAASPKPFESVSPPAWTIRSLTHTVRAANGFVIEFAPHHLLNLFQNRTALLVRQVQPPSPTTQLLLSDWVTIETQEWLLKIETQAHPDDPQRVTLYAELVPEQMCPLRIILRWAEQSYTQLANEQGFVRFGDLPALVLQQPTPNISLTVEMLEN